MKHLCVIGDPVGHSLSPRLHQGFIEKTGVDYDYGICPVRPAELTDFVRRAKAGDWAGFNVTMPHKQAILPLLDELTEEARRIGAVNTVKIENGRAIGHNTDGQGFLNSLRENHFALRGKTVLLLGSGGAARAIAMTLAGEGCRVAIYNRTAEKAEALAACCGGDAVSSPLLPWHLLVNATCCGMTGRDAFPNFDFLRAAAPEAAVYDLVYEPRETALLAAAAARGLRTTGGLALLEAQARLAFTFFTGVRVSSGAGNTKKSEKTFTFTI
jgi:shikimate dehydrogenase